MNYTTTRKTFNKNECNPYTTAPELRGSVLNPTFPKNPELIPALFLSAMKYRHTKKTPLPQEVCGNPPETLKIF